MTREEYVKKLNENDASLCNSIINDVIARVEIANVFEWCKLSEEQSLLISKRQIGTTIIKDLEKKYPFLTFTLTNFNTLIIWKLKEEK